MNTRIVSHAICSNCHSEVTELITGTTMCTACNGAHLGKFQRDMLDFARDGKIHSLSTDRFTQKVAKSLVNRGLITINEFNQFSIVKSD